MKKFLPRILFISFLLPSICWGVEQKAVPVINITNPNFRKIIFALPSFNVSNEDSSKIDSGLRDGAVQLSYYLKFSGFFNLIAEPTYKDLVPMLIKYLGEKDKGKIQLQVNSLKAIGIEAITLGEAKVIPGAQVLELQTIDIATGNIILAKRFSGNKKDWYVDALKSYANQLVTAFTGKPGIFSSKIVFVGRSAPTANKQIYVCDFDGSNIKKLTNLKKPLLSPSWSPDGRYILFTSYEAGNPDLYRYDTLTANIAKVANDKGLNSGGNYSHNAKVIAYTGSVNGDADLFIKKASPLSGARKLFISGEGLDSEPKFSPDGKFLAYVSGRFGNPHVFVASLKWSSDTEVKVLADKRITYAGWYNASPAWAPNGDKLAFSGYDKDIDRFDIFTVNPDGAQLERLTINAGDNETPSWAPNGHLIVFASNRSPGRNIKAKHHIYMMRRDGSEQRQLPIDMFEAYAPNWGPNL